MPHPVNRPTPPRSSPASQVPKQLKTVQVILIACGIVNILIASVVLVALAATVRSVTETELSIPAAILQGSALLCLGIANLVLAPRVGRGDRTACTVALWLLVASLVLRIVDTIASVGILGTLGTINLIGLLEVWAIVSLLSAPVRALGKKP